jgi:hypothetical protein
MDIKSIDERIKQALELLTCMQKLSLGFETLKQNPNSESGLNWIHELKNAFLSANVLLPLTKINDKSARDIVEREFSFLLPNQNTLGLWHYFNNTDAPFFIPFETDTNSLMNYIAERLKKKTLDKKYFYQQISENGYINLWFIPRLKFLLTDPFFYFIVKANMLKSKKYLAFKNNAIFENDSEFSVTANALLFLGQNENTKVIISKLLSDIYSEKEIVLLYYPYQIIALYLFSRSYYYGEITDFKSAVSFIESRIETSYYSEVNNTNTFLTVLAANSLLFFSIKSSFTENLIEQSWNLYEQIETPFAFYCSNSVSDFNNTSKLHNAYFGSTALNISIYIEFLNLLRLSRFGKLYGN